MSDISREKFWTFTATKSLALGDRRKVCSIREAYLFIHLTCARSPSNQPDSASSTLGQSRGCCHLPFQSFVPPSSTPVLLQLFIHRQGSTHQNQLFLLLHHHQRLHSIGEGFLFFITSPNITSSRWSPTAKDSLILFVHMAINLQVCSNKLRVSPDWNVLVPQPGWK